VPEGDTIHRWAHRLDAALTGHALTRLDFRRDPRGNRLPPPGTTITGVEARGKHLLVHFGDGAVLHTHMELHGRWDVYRARERWHRPAHTARVVIEIDDGTQAVCFSAPIVELRRNGRGTPPTSAARALAALGPDLCVVPVDIDEVVRRADTVDPATTVADVLLDQRVGAGIGNVYKSEICWACRVHPMRAYGTLDAPTRRCLFETAHTMLHANVDTNRRVTYRGGLAVYGRESKPCARCRSRIEQAYAGDTDRTTFWCPSCQPPPEPA
jgi:endonuclease-8